MSKIVVFQLATGRSTACTQFLVYLAYCTPHGDLRQNYNYFLSQLDNAIGYIYARYDESSYKKDSFWGGGLVKTQFIVLLAENFLGVNVRGNFTGAAKLSTVWMEFMLDDVRINI